MRAVLEGVDDPITAMATVSCLVHHAFGHLWTGFYRVVAPASCAWALTKGRSVASRSLSAKVCAARRRPKVAPWSLPTSRPFRGTSPATAGRSPRSSYRCAIAKARSSPSSTSTPSAQHVRRCRSRGARAHPRLVPRTLTDAPRRRHRLHAALSPRPPGESEC